MSNFFQNVSDSEDEREEGEEIEETEEAEETAGEAAEEKKLKKAKKGQDDDAEGEEEGISKWLKKDADNAEKEDGEEGASKWLKKENEGSDDDEDADEGEIDYFERLKSKVTVRDLEGASEKLSEKLDCCAPWEEVYDLQFRLAPAIQEYQERNVAVPLKVLQRLDEWANAVKDQMDRADFDSDKEFEFYVKYRELVLNLQSRYSAQLAAMKGEGQNAAAAQEEQDWSEEGMLKMLRQIPSMHRGKAQRCDAIARNAEQQGFRHLAVAALALAATANLDERAGALPAVAKVWCKSFDSLRRAFGIAESAIGLAVMERDEEGKELTEKRTVVPGGFFSLAIRLHEEYLRGCQFATPQDDHFERVREENDLLDLADRLFAYYEKRQSRKPMAQLANVMIEIVSVRAPKAHALLFDKMVSPSHTIITKDIYELVPKLHSVVMTTTPDSEIQARSTLCLAYHYALCDRYNEARDLILRARLHELYQFEESSFRVLFNRVVVQLGLSAFRAGKFDDCNEVLVDITSHSAREMKQLLGQEIQQQFFSEYDEKKELVDRERLVPPHHHIPVELVEVCSLVCCMLHDVVDEVKRPYERKRRERRPFTKIVNQLMHMAILGPAADSRDAVYSAYLAIQEGDVVKAYSVVRSMTCWNSLPIEQRDTVLEQLHHRMKCDALNVFLIRHGCDFASLTLRNLAQRFLLTESEVRVLITQLLLEYNSPIVGYWEHDEQSLIIEMGNPSRLHHLADQVSDRISGIYWGQREGGRGEGRGRGSYGRGRGRGRGRRGN